MQLNDDNIFNREIYQNCDIKSLNKIINDDVNKSAHENVEV